MKVSPKTSVIVSFIRLFLIFLTILSVSVNNLNSQRKYNSDPSILKDPTGYKIRTGDRVRISVREQPETNVEVLIDSEGKARAAYLGELKISGLSTKQVEKMLILEYQRQLIFKNPIVNVYILKYSERVVFLSGSVNRKGPYILPPEVEAMNIVEVIARAGGFSDIARKDKVFITRTFYNQEGDVKDTKTFPVNVEALSKGSLDEGSSKRFWIYPGDRIEVPERLF
jgi:protein involved in polysaccharide export with SLBB domain